jgi:hypothetical protein
MRRALCLVFIVVVYGSTAAAFAGTDAPPSTGGKDLIPLATWHKQFKITDGKDRGKVVPLTLQGDPQQGRWNLVFGDYAGIHLRNDLQGLAVERLDLFKGRSYIVYEPTLPILTADKNASTPIRLQASFKMFDRDSGKLKRTGRVTHLVKQVTPSRFDTPAGLIDGYFIEIDQQMDMQFAQLHMALGIGCRLDDGPVFGSGQYTLTKLGVFTESKTAAAGLSKSQKLAGS